MRRGLFIFLFFFGLGTQLLFSTDVNVIRDKNSSPAYASYLKGLLSERYGEPKRALSEFIKARKFDEQSGSLSLRVAVGYIKLNRIQEAIDLLSVLKNDKPVNLDVYLLLVLLRSNQGQEDKANAEYKEMLAALYKERPDNAKIADSLAQFELYSGQLDQAQKIYEDIIKSDPTYPEAYFWIGYLHEEKGERIQAIESWKKALALSPGHADSLNSLGYVYAEEGINLNEAEVLVKRALEISPDSPAYLDSLGWVYFKKNDLERAKEYVEKAASLLPDPVILEHLKAIQTKIEKAKNEVLGKKD